MKSDHPDEIFDDLAWSAEDECWTGATSFLGLSLPLLIDFDASQPTDAEKQTALIEAKNVYSKLDEAWEQTAKQSAAQEVLEAAYCQSEHEPTSEELKELLDDMQLASLDLTYDCEEQRVFPYLSYNSPNCFPGMRINIQFSTDLSIAEVMVDE